MLQAAVPGGRYDRRYLLPAGAPGLQQTRSSSMQRANGTDRWTADGSIDQACSAYYAGNVNKQRIVTLCKELGL